MSIAFYIFIVSLVGMGSLFTLRHVEYARGEIRSFSTLRKRSDKVLDRFLSSALTVVHRVWERVSEDIPRITKALYWRVRSSKIKVIVKRILAEISRFLHDVLLSLLKFFGRMRKRFEEFHRRHSD